MTEPADAGGRIRASAAEDKTYRSAVRRTIMMPERDEVSTTHARAERYEGDKAARKLESQRQTRAAEKASKKHDLAKTRNVNKQQREDEEASTRNTQRAEWQQTHRARERKQRIGF